MADDSAKILPSGSISRLLVPDVPISTPMVLATAYRSPAPDSLMLKTPMANTLAQRSENRRLCEKLPSLGLVYLGAPSYFWRNVTILRSNALSYRTH